ncbi:MAG TPA: thioredoxin family protein [Spirillospora sp.]|nr:thioredoxin family protein [Spirillospora sp.]
MAIEFLYYEDCPSHDVALERLQTIMAEEGIHADINIIKVETEDQAQRLKFVGSPTIRIGGQDIVPVPANAHYSLTCRAYRLDDGRISPLPSPDMIRRALREHIASV